MVDYTKRPPDYFGDIKKYGHFGEDLFLEKFSSSMNIVDVRENKSYQRDDIDFLVARENRKYLSVDVKVDTVALKTGNLAFEVVSHSSSGWAMVTKADYIFIVLADETNWVLTPKVGYWLDMQAWRGYCADRANKKTINTVVSEGIVDLLCPITLLKEKEIIKKEVFF